MLLSACKTDFESEHMITLFRFWRTQSWTAARSAMAAAVKMIGYPVDGCCS